MVRGFNIAVIVWLASFWALRTYTFVDGVWPAILATTIVAYGTWITFLDNVIDKRKEKPIVLRGTIVKEEAQ